MAQVAYVKNLARLVAKLQARATRAKKDGDASVAVGYTASYAIHVHEKHATKSKFLERPVRELRHEMSKLVEDRVQRGQTVAQALLQAGLLLQRESQLLVPVRTGNLKGSAFTRLESGR